MSIVREIYGSDIALDLLVDKFYKEWTARATALNWSGNSAAPPPLSMLNVYIRQIRDEIDRRMAAEPEIDYGLFAEDQAPDVSFEDARDIAEWIETELSEVARRNTLIDAEGASRIRDHLERVFRFLNAIKT